MGTPLGSARDRVPRVQSITRAFELVETLADMGGIAGLSQLAGRSGLPLPTTYRLLRTLADLGYIRQQPSREYALGPRLIRLGDSSSRLLGTSARAHLAELVNRTGESANLAILDADQIIYTAQVPGLHAMRMYTEVGRRAWAHCTAVGKAILATRPATQVAQIVQSSGMPTQTPRTITSLSALCAELDTIRARGYAVDDEEQEIGVRCVAVVLPGQPSNAAVSISGPCPRMAEQAIARAIPLLTRCVHAIANETALANPPAGERTG